jgi:hypothetical protein
LSVTTGLEETGSFIAFSNRFRAFSSLMIKVFVIEDVAIFHSLFDYALLPVIIIANESFRDKVTFFQAFSKVPHKEAGSSHRFPKKRTNEPSPFVCAHHPSGIP